MNASSHIHSDGIIVDADPHFKIDTISRAITTSSKKLTLMQYDHKSERYTFEMDKIIEGHDITECNRVQIHFINVGVNKQKHYGLYLVEDMQVKSSDDTKITFTWLVSQDATMLNGNLQFLVSFECVEGDTIVYRWSSSVSTVIQIITGMDNDNTIIETYADELLAWQNYMETRFIPDMVDERYIERDFATSDEVAGVFGMAILDSVTSNVVSYDEMTEYVDTAIGTAITQTLGGSY